MRPLAAIRLFKKVRFLAGGLGIATLLLAGSASAAAVQSAEAPGEASSSRSQSAEAPGEASSSRSQGAEANRIVAVVNDEVVTQAELNRALVPVYFQLQATLGPEELAQEMENLKKRVLQQIIDEHLMLQEARHPRPVEVSKGKVGTPPVIIASDEEVDKMLQETRAHFPNEEGFQEALQQQGVTVEDLKDRFRDQGIIQKLISREVRSRVSVSPAEITAYYEGHREEFVTAPAVQVATLLIRPRDGADVPRAFARAQEIQKELAAGADFYETARKNSDGFNAQMGGRMGVLEKGKNIQEIDDVLFKLKAGEISPVVKTPAGFHLFLIESVRPSHQATLEEVKGDLRYKLLNQKGAQRYQQWIAKLRSEAYITLK